MLFHGRYLGDDILEMKIVIRKFTIFKILYKTSTNGYTLKNRCGGSILDENWVLSAGHCCRGLGDEGEIVAGTNDR